MAKGTKISASVRRAKMSAYRKCAFCGTTKDLECAHFNPRHDATFENIIVCCSRCHMKYMHDEEVVHRHADMVRNGIKEAKERGVHFGKKPADYENVMKLIAKYSTQFNDVYDVDYELKTEHEIMKMAGVKDVCYSKCKRMLFEAMTADVWPYSWEKPVQVRNRPLYDSFIRKMRGDAV